MLDITGAEGQNRTADTGIFSPLLYRLSYLGFWGFVCKYNPNLRVPLLLNPLIFVNKFFLVHKQLRIKFEIRILASQSRFAECELFLKNLLMFDIAAKRRKKHKK